MKSDKELWKPGTMIYPAPAVLVSCGEAETGYNIITIAWTGTVCSDPPMCSISIRPERYSHGLISRTGEFVINLTTEALARATDWCGVKSGRDFDKFKEMGLTPAAASRVRAPLIQESPLNIECRVADVRRLGSHDLFLAEVLAIQADRRLISPSSGAFRLSSARPLCYVHGNYYGLGGLIGKFGWSVQKKPANHGQRQKRPQ